MVANSKLRTVEYDNKTIVSQIAYIEHIDIPLMVLGVSLKDIGGISTLESALTASQMEMVRKVFEVIASDIEQDNMKPYLDGVVPKRYLSDKIEMEESNFKHKLARIASRLSSVK